MELHYHAKIVSRGNGGNAVRAAAYFARCEMTDERTGETFDFSHKPGLAFHQLFLPKGAPEWAADEGRFWNELHKAETRCDSQLARSIDIALPHELTPHQMELWARDHVRDNFLRKGFAVQASLHEPSLEGDNRNWHLHLLQPLRKFEGEGFTEKPRTTWAEKVAEIKHLRERAATTMNRTLERYGHDKRVEYRSFEERGIDREPEQRQSPGEIAQARREGETPPHELAREILERRTRDLMADAAREQRQELARDENQQIDRAIFELGRTDPTLAATFIKPTAEPIQIVLHDEGKTLELLGGGGSPEAPQTARREPEAVPVMDVAAKQPEPATAPEIEPVKPIWRDHRPEPVRPSVPFFAAVFEWAWDKAARIVGAAAAGLLHQVERQPDQVRQVEQPNQVRQVEQPNQVRQADRQADQVRQADRQLDQANDIAADRLEAARRRVDDRQQETERQKKQEPEPQKKRRRSLEDDPLSQKIMRELAAEKAAAALRKDLKRNHELDGGLEL